jgi:alkylation response protein AidB-like acyl-CoA dehydrogenase
MKLADDPEVEEFRADFAAFLDAHLPEEAEARERAGSSAHVPAWDRRWQRTLFDAGWLLPGQPPEYGGRNAGLPQQLAHLEELARRRIYHSFNPQGLGIIAASLLTFGTEEQKRRWAVPILRAEITAALGMSEPEAGSDLAALRTRAVADRDAFVVNGQKIWTSGAHDADVLLTFVRTDPDAPKHQGISALLIPTGAEGVVRRPFGSIAAEDDLDFNEVFLTDVRIPDDHRLGEVDGGWTVALTTLMNERATVGSEGVGPVGAALSPDHLSALMRATWTWDDRALRARLAELLVDVLATGHLNARALRKLRAGVAPGPEMSISKLMYGQNLTHAAHFVSDVLGPRIIADTGQWGTYAWTELLLATPALRILGGTEEIMKNILAERVLGLPKEPVTAAAKEVRP